MINKAKLALIAAVAAVSVVSPALARMGSSWELGCGHPEVEYRQPAEHCCFARCLCPADGADVSELADIVRLRPWRDRDVPGPCGALCPSGWCVWPGHDRQLMGACVN